MSNFINNKTIGELIREHCEPNTKEKNKYHCPCCGGDNLGVSKNNEKYNCFNGCDSKDVTKAVLKKAGVTKPTKYKKGRKFEYFHHDSNRKPLVKVTKEYLDNGAKKVRQLTRDIQGKWQFGYEGQDKIIEDTCCLYRWHEIKDLSGVHIVEGESVADKLMEIGTPATTLLRGSDAKFTELKKQQLKSLKNPIICPDRDIPGIKFADKIAEVLDEGGNDYYWCYPHPDSRYWQQLPPSNGYDLEDWLIENNVVSASFYKEEKIHTSDSQEPRKDKESFDLTTLPKIIKQIELSDRTEPEKVVDYIELQKTANIHPIEISNLIKSIKAEIAKEEKNSKIIDDAKLIIAEKDFIKNLKLKNEFKQQYKFNEKQVEGILAHVSGLSMCAKPEVFDVLDFLELDLDSGQILFPGIPATGVTLMGGTYGAGKTLVSFAIARAVNEGIPLFGEMPTRKGPVLIVSSDESQSATQDKLLSLGYSQKGNRVIFNWNVENWEILESHVQEINPQLIVVDSYTGIHSRGFEENSPDAARTIYDLTKLSVKYNCAVLLLHHLNKQGGFRGSSAIPAAAEATLLLTGERDEARTLKSDKLRIQGGRIDVVYRIDDDRWPIETSGGAEFSDEETSDQIFSYLLEKGCGEVDEIGTHLNKNFSTIRKSLNTLLAKGIAERRPSKKDKRRRVWRLKNVKPRYGNGEKSYTVIQKNVGTTVIETEREVQPQKSEKMREPIKGVSHIFSDSESLLEKGHSENVGTDRGGGVAPVENISGGVSHDGSHNFAESNTGTELQPKKNVGTSSDGSHNFAESNTGIESQPKKDVETAVIETEKEVQPQESEKMWEPTKGGSHNFAESNTGIELQPEKDVGTTDTSHISHNYEFVSEDNIGRKVDDKDWLKPNTKLIFQSHEGFIKCRFKSRSGCGLVAVEIEKGVETMVSFEHLFWFRLT